MTIMEEYVPIELAKKLEEKGFPQGNKDHMKCEDVKCYCPTIPQVMEWFIIKKRLYMFPNVVVIDNAIKWYFQIDELHPTNTIYTSRLIYKSCEEASLKGIKYVLDNLI